MSEAYWAVAFPKSSCSERALAIRLICLLVGPVATAEPATEGAVESARWLQGRRPPSRLAKRLPPEPLIMVGSGRYGLKVLKDKLSEYLRLAASGETVRVTDRDRVVAEIVPPNPIRSLLLGAVSARRTLCVCGARPPSTRWGP
jgi:antitoxin (DNA-binding transcriptional repressor) of toxin-antitoxin stability system